MRGVRRACGQGDVLAVAILVGTALILGVGFLGLVVPQISNLMTQNDVRGILNSEQSLLVVYKEFEDGAVVCLGILRIEPGLASYAVALLTPNGTDVLARAPGALYFPLNPSAAVRLTPTPSRNILLLVGQEHAALGGPGLVLVSYLPSEVLESSIRVGRPALLCVSKERVRNVAEAATLYILYPIGSDLYEIGRVILSAA